MAAKARTKTREKKVAPPRKTRAAAPRDAPRDPPSDFQPLLESLREVADGLAATQSSFSDALFQMPHPDEYEPLAAPLRQFARASPRMIEILEDIQRRLPPAPPGEGHLAGLDGGTGHTTPPAGAPAARESLQEVADDVEAARQKVRAALDGLPKDADYASVAGQLRELATVSPSLMEWLREVPKVSQPLAASTRDLHDAVALLESAGGLLADAMRALEIKD